jgi:IS5 family transposase
VLRLLILKHIRNWSYAIVEREVRANLVCRDFTRVGRAKVADAKSMGRWGLTLGPEVIEQIHQRIVKIGQEHQILEGRQMRVDTTEVETNIWNPTDSSFLGDAVRVGTTLRDRSRRVKRRVMEIARAARSKGRQVSRSCNGAIAVVQVGTTGDLGGFSHR